MKPFINILAWLAAGILLGLVVFYAIAPQAPPSNATYVPPANVTPPANATANATANTTANATIPVVKKSIDITLIEAPGCDRCNVIGNLLLNQSRDEISQSSAAQVGNISVLDGSSPEAAALISKYSLGYLPAVLVSDSSGFTSQDMNVWTTQIGTVEPDGYLVQREVYPPYYNIANKTVEGFVDSIAISASNCNECMNATDYVGSLENSSSIQMAFSNKTVLQENSTQAQELISKYNITELPALMLSLDVSAYPVYQQLKALGTEQDGWFILRGVHPPYVDLAANRTIRGLVSLIQITNASCTDCYTPDTLSDYIVNNAGIYLVNKTTYDINSTAAQALVAKYNITFIPTILFSPDLKYYPHFETIWTSQNDTVEPDGWFVFRAYSVITEPYQNLTVEAQPQNATNQTG